MKTAPRLLSADFMCFRSLLQPMHFVSRKHSILASTPTRFTDSCANAFCEYARSKPNSGLQGCCGGRVVRGLCYGCDESTPASDHNAASPVTGRQIPKRAIL